MVSPPLKIGILGTGNMGRALGIRFAQLGYTVYFSARANSPSAANAAALAKSQSPNASVLHGTLDAAAKGSDVLIWMMRERDPAAVLSAEGIAVLKGKLVIDVNNRDFAADVVGEGGKGVRMFEESLGEQLQAKLLGVYVVKAFNSVAMEALDTSAERLRAAGAQVWVAGLGPSDVRGVAARLVEELGFEALDLGDGPTPMRMAEALGDAVRWVMIENGKGGLANLGVRMLPKPDLGVVGARAESKYH